MYVITWITTHLPTSEGWMAELAMLADLVGKLNKSQEIGLRCSCFMCDCFDADDCYL